MVRVVRPLRGGQITIPADFREELGIDGSTLLQVTLEEGELRIKPVRVTEAKKGSPWLKELYELFAPIRAEAGRHGKKEVEKTLDQALTNVRKTP